MLLDGDRVVGAAFDRRVVANDHALAAGDFADSGDDAGRWRSAVVHAIGGKLRQLKERCAGIEQHLHTIARQQLATSDVFAACLLATAGGNGRDLVL